MTQTIPPSIVLPKPDILFDRRSRRFRTLAEGAPLGPFLGFLAVLSDLQQDAVRAPGLMAVFDRLLTGAADLPMPDGAGQALDRLLALDVAGRERMLQKAQGSGAGADDPAAHVFVAAALQVHFAKAAAATDPASAGPAGDGLCPVCRHPPVASMLVGWPQAENCRYCACPQCATMWNVVRVKCVPCGSTKGISYQEFDGGNGIIKAELCSSCGGYLKIIDQRRDPDAEALADDVASLGLDLLMREAGSRRGGVNPFLIGY